MFSDLVERYFFVEAVASCHGADDDFRASILRRYGEVGPVELSLAIAVYRMFSTGKHVMGYAGPRKPKTTSFSTLRRSVFYLASSLQLTLLRHHSPV
ncbi:MAG: hypothetical protein AB7P24_16830 [Nitrospira sp.]